MSKAYYFHYYNFRIYLHLLVGFDQKYFLKQWVQTAISFQIIVSCLFLLFVSMTMNIYSLNVLETSLDSKVGRGGVPWCLGMRYLPS